MSRVMRPGITCNKNIKSILKSAVSTLITVSTLISHVAKLDSFLLLQILLTEMKDIKLLIIQIVKALSASWD